MIEITLNGELRELSADATVAQLLSSLGLESKPVAVEVNRELVPRGRFAQHRLVHGDTVEVVTLVGGG